MCHCQNLWLNKCRRDQRETGCEEPDRVISNREIALEQYIIDRDLSMQVHQVLHRLNEPYKEVFSLRIFGQLSFAQIARVFSKTESWARVTYHRARKMIIEAMRKDGTL